MPPDPGQVFCPKCGRPQALEAECRGCKVVVRRFLERAAVPGWRGGRVFCLQCGEPGASAVRCASCGCVQLDRYNLLAGVSGLPLARVEPVYLPRAEPRLTSRARTVRSLGLPVIALAVLAAVVVYLFGLRGSAAYAEAEAFLLGHPDVLRLLGPGLREDVFPRGAVELLGRGDRATFVLDVRGQGGRGKARLELTRPGGLWQVVRADIRVRGHERPIDLVPVAPVAAVAHGRAGGAGGTVTRLEEAVARSPADYDLCLQLDLALTSEGRFSDVVLLWNDYLSHAVDDPRAWFARARAHHREGRLPEARSDMAQACDLGHAEACRRLER